FAALCYGDMPFVLAPNSWAALRGPPRRLPLSERPHGDGIRVNAQSPEAFDEVFWRTLDGERYIGEHCLLPHQPPPELGPRFADYLRAVQRARGGHRYLSKNNNNVLRLPALMEWFPQAVFLVPFRLPLEHVASLRRQHARMSQYQREDPFFRQYMRWLGHHEFGLDKRRLAAGGHQYLHHDPQTWDYWLEEWLAVYGEVERLLSSGTPLLPVAYERLCASDSPRWQQLCQCLRLQPEHAGSPPFRSANRQLSDPPQNATLLPAANALYQRLLDWDLRGQFTCCP
ncbi:MAG: hypothetical protein VBE63_24285, partial [Lamprobacter sp.]|uniref:hypothetical protein n=1 Tax=Lamprobacter sp. TaxID=3100796 RepID=UPI002B256722